MKKTNNNGFSLVELIIVIAIMAVLIGVLAPQFVKYVEQSRESTDLQNVEEIKTTIETIYADDDTLSGATTVTITGSTQKINVTGSVDSNKLAPYGITIDTSKKALKSPKWADITWTYSDYKWTSNPADPSGAGATYYNWNGSKKATS